MNSNPTKSHPEMVHRDTSVNFLLQPLQRWLEDRQVTEICVNRPFEVFCEREGQWTRYEDARLSLSHLRSLATAIAKFTQSTISESHPILSAHLPQGERIQMVVPPACCTDTVSLTIRKPSQKIVDLQTFEAQQFFAKLRPSQPLLLQDEKHLIQLKEKKQYRVFLEQAVKLKKNIVVAGSTGSGKTTLMKSLLQAIPQQERLITIEDVPELGLPNHPNHVHLFYPSEGSEPNATTLLKSCLRMKPDRILLAELRGGETFDFVNIAASGHGGSITSLHAGSVRLAFERLLLMMLQNPQGRKLPVAVIRRLLVQVIDVVIHIHCDESTHVRYMSELWYEPQKKMEAFEQDSLAEEIA